MKTKKYLIFLTLICCCAVLLPVGTSGIFTYSFEKFQLVNFGVSTLHGLKGVKPTVLFRAGKSDVLKSDLPTNLVISGLSESTLQTQVELELRKTGINIVEDKEAPVLFVRVFIVKLVAQDYYIYSVSMKLTEEVELIRDRKIHTFSSTWPPSIGSLLYAPRVGADVTLGITQAIKNEVDNLIKEFCNDYLAANPKETESKKQE